MHRIHRSQSADQIIVINGIATEVILTYRHLHEVISAESPDFAHIASDNIKFLVHEHHADVLVNAEIINIYPAKLNVLVSVAARCMNQSTEKVIELDGDLGNCQNALDDIVTILVKAGKINKRMKTSPYNLLNHNDHRANDQLSYRVVWGTFLTRKWPELKKN